MRPGALALAALLAVAPSAAAGQEALDRVAALAGAGRADDAREALTTWWSEAAADAPRGELQRGLWLRGLLTVDPGQAMLDFRRLVVEFPGGPHTDDALLRLAQAERARGRPGVAASHLRTLSRDYPSSPERLRARSLLEAVEAEAARDEARGVLAAAAENEGRVGDDPASRGADAGAGQRGPAAPAAAPVRSEGSPPAMRAPGADAAVGAYAVQLGAFSSAERARALLRRAREAGLEPRLVRVPGSTLVRVRTGRLSSLESAERSRAAIGARGFDAMVVANADQEEAVP